MRKLRLGLDVSAQSGFAAYRAGRAKPTRNAHKQPSTWTGQNFEHVSAGAFASRRA